MENLERSRFRCTHESSMPFVTYLYFLIIFVFVTICEFLAETKCYIRGEERIRIFFSTDVDLKKAGAS